MKDAEDTPTVVEAKELVIVELPLLMHPSSLRTESLSTVKRPLMRPSWSMMESLSNVKLHLMKRRRQGLVTALYMTSTECLPCSRK